MMRGEESKDVRGLGRKSSSSQLHLKLQKTFLIEKNFELYLGYTLTWDYSSCTIDSDLKLLNILLGLMSHSSHWSQRTIGSLNQLNNMYRNLRDANVDNNRAKNFGNIVNPTI